MCTNCFLGIMITLTCASSFLPVSRAAKPSCSRNGQTEVDGHLQLMQCSRRALYPEKCATCSPSSPIRFNAPFLLNTRSPRCTISSLALTFFDLYSARTAKFSSCVSSSGILSVDMAMCNALCLLLAIRQE